MKVYDLMFGQVNVTTFDSRRCSLEFFHVEGGNLYFSEIDTPGPGLFRQDFSGVESCLFVFGSGMDEDFAFLLPWHSLAKVEVNVNNVKFTLTELLATTLTKIFLLT